MPKSKPTQVIVHRIELQEKERELIEPLLISQSYKNVVIPTAILGGVGAATYIGYKAAKSFFEWGDDMIDDVKNSYGAMATEHFIKHGGVVTAPVRLGQQIFKLFTTPIGK